MHVQKITTNMINEFNECTLMRDYRYFYTKQRSSIKRLYEDFRYLNFSNSPRCNFITQNFWQLFKFLRDYPFSDPKKVVCYSIETGDPEFVADMKTAIDSKNWDSFYWKYRRLADFIIDQARAEKVLSITFEWNGKFYSNFGEIENAKLPQRTSYISRNFGEMLTLRPRPLPYLSTSRQNSRSFSPNRSAENTPRREDSFYRKACNIYNSNTGSYASVNSGGMLAMRPEPSLTSTISSQNTVASSPNESTLTKLSRLIFGGHSRQPETVQNSQPKAKEMETEALEKANSSPLVTSKPPGGQLDEEPPATPEPCDTHQETHGDYSLQPHKVVPDQMSRAENSLSDEEVLPQSKSLEQPSSENTDSALRTIDAAETTIISEAEETMLTQKVSSEMIKVFHDCTSNKDYRNFYNTNEMAIKNLAEKLNLLNFPLSKRTCFITKNLLKIFKFLRDYPFCDERKIVPGCIVLEEDPEFLEDMKNAIDSKNWNPFYQKYWKIADFMINQAREQKVLDVTIEWKSNFYPNFESIRIAKLPPYKPYQAKNSGEMLRYRPGPSPYLSTRLQCSRNSSPNRSTGRTLNRRNSFYREARNEYNQISSNQSSCGSHSQTNRNTGSGSEVGLAPRSLRFDYGISNSQQQLASQANRSSQSDYRRFLTQHDEPLACSENVGSVFISCCRALGNRSVDYSSQSQQIRSSSSSSTTAEKGSTHAYQETHTDHYLQNREESHFQRKIDFLLDKGYQSSQYQDSSPRSNAQLVGQDFNGAQSKRYDNDLMQSSPGGRDGQETRQEPFDKMKDHAAITSSEPFKQQETYQNSTMKPPVSQKYEDVHQFHSLQPGIDLTRESTHSQMTNTKLKPVAADNLTSIGPYSRTHGDVSLGSEVVIDNQTASFKTTHSSNQELPPSQEQLGPENRGSTLKVEIPTEHTSTLGAETVVYSQASPHQETYGGYSIQPQSVVPNETSDNTRSDYGVLFQSKSLEQSPSDVSDNISRAKWPEAAPMTVHSEEYGGHFLQSQSAIHNQALGCENAQSSYQVPQPSESMKTSHPEFIEKSFEKEQWGSPEPTTTPQEFSLMNDLGDVETLKKHDDSFEELKSDTVRPDDEEQIKLSSEEFEVVDDHRSSMSSINIDFSTVEDSVISHQSCFDLDDLRRTNDSPVESIDAKFDNELFKHQVEMNQVNRDVMRTKNLITEELNAMQRQETIIPKYPDLAEEEEDSFDFNRQFEKMKRQQAEESQKIREERRRKQQKLDDELRRRTNKTPGDSIDAKFDDEFVKHQVEMDQVLNKMNVSEVETTEQLTNENIVELESTNEDRPITSGDQLTTTEADGHRDEDAIRKHLKEKERKRQMARRKRNTKH